MTASVIETVKTQNMARGPVPWRASVGVSLVTIRSVLSRADFSWELVKRTSMEGVPAPAGAAEACTAGASRSSDMC